MIISFYSFFWQQRVRDPESDDISMI